MARKQDDRDGSAKDGAKKGKGRKAEAGSPAKGKSKAAARGLSARPRGAAAALEAVRTPIVDASTAASSKTRKALKAARKQAARLVPEVQAPAMPDIAGQVGEAFRTIGSQVASAVNTPVGRVILAELLIHVAKSLTKAAASTEAAEDAKTALLNAGAKIGAAAADAGAKMVETGKDAAEAGARMVETGKDAASAGVEAAGEAAGSARDLVAQVAQVAVGAVGGVVADAAQRALGGRGSRASASKAGATPAASEGGPSAGGGTPRPGRASAAGRGRIASPRAATGSPTPPITPSGGAT